MFETLTCILLGIACAQEVIEAGPVTVTFYNNGGTHGGVELHFDFANITSEQVLDQLRETSSSFVPQLFLPEGSRLFNGSGLQLNSLVGCLDGDRVYVVPSDKPFHWPFVELGHRVRALGLKDKEDVWIESINENPRVFFLHNFMNPEEPDKLRDRALAATGVNKLDKSTTGARLRESRDLTDPQSFSETRTSDNAWDMVSADATPIIRRSFDIAGMPYNKKYQDGLQVLRYQVRQAYNAHHDYFPARRNDGGFNFDAQAGGANRLITIFLYISDVIEGGQTVFPSADPLTDEQLTKLSPELQELLQSHKKEKDNVTALVNSLFPKGTWQPGMVRDCYSKLSVKPRKGAAVMFYSMNPDNTMNPQSLHGGCPVLEGVKWGANMWIWNEMRYGHGPDPSYEIAVAFVNGWGSEGQLVWKEDKSAEAHTIQPGEVLRQNSFHGHAWEFRVGNSVQTHTLHANLGKFQDVQFTPKAVILNHMDLNQLNQLGARSGKSEL